MKCTKSAKKEHSCYKKEESLRKRSVFLPYLPWPLRLMLYAATVMLAAAAVGIAGKDSLPVPAAAVIYALAALTFGISGCYLAADIRAGIVGKVIPGMESVPFANRMVKDYRYRTVFTTFLGLSVSLLFAAYHMVLGIVSRSVWFGTLAVYYILLSLMRLKAARYGRIAVRCQKRAADVEKERKIYRSCGIFLILLTFALGGSVVQMVCDGRGRKYSEIHVIAVAAYTFYKVIISVIHVVKAGKLKSPLLMTIRNIGCADALMSLLSLQAAMFLCFHTADESFPRLMNSLTGAGVCLILLGMGIYMLKSKGILNNSQTKL